MYIYISYNGVVPYKIFSVLEICDMFCKQVQES